MTGGCFQLPSSPSDSSESESEDVGPAMYLWLGISIQGECRSGGKLLMELCLSRPCHEFASVPKLSPRKMIRNSGNSLDDLSWSVGEGVRLESTFSERELDRLDLDDLLDLVSKERILADDFLRPSSFGICFGERDTTGTASLLETSLSIFIIVSRVAGGSLVPSGVILVSDIIDKRSGFVTRRRTRLPNGTFRIIFRRGRDMTLSVADTGGSGSVGRPWSCGWTTGSSGVETTISGGGRGLRNDWTEDFFSNPRRGRERL